MNRDELIDLLEDWYEHDSGAYEQIETWLHRGDDILVYQNMDMEHYDLGHPICMSWGSDEAQVPRAQFPEPPLQCPVDLGQHGLMAWRYRLKGVLYADPVEVAHGDE